MLQIEEIMKIAISYFVGPLILSKHIHMPMCFTNLTIKLLAEICILESGENMKIAISYFMVLYIMEVHYKARIHAYWLYKLYSTTTS